MPKLQVRAMVRLYGVSEKLNKKGLYKLLPFKNKAFNEEIGESEIEDTLTKLVNDLYCHETQYPWVKCRFLFDFDTDPNELETVRIEIDDDEFLGIEDITDIIDTGSGCCQFYIIVNPTRTEYRWIVATLYNVYTEQKDETE